MPSLFSRARTTSTPTKKSSTNLGAHDEFGRIDSRGSARQQFAASTKKSKKDKDKNVRMVYDDELSPEERMAAMPRYAFVPEAAAA